MTADRDALAAEVERLKMEADESHDLRARMEQLLIGAANGLKGDPGPLTRHDWSDLPAIAAEAKAQVGKLTRLMTIREDQIDVAKRGKRQAERDLNAARARVAELEAQLAEARGNDRTYVSPVSMDPNFVPPSASLNPRATVADTAEATS